MTGETVGGRKWGSFDRYTMQEKTEHVLHLLVKGLSHFQHAKTGHLYA